MSKEPMILKNPLVVMFMTDDGRVQCNIHPYEGLTHEGYGLLICDLVRHVANAFKVDEHDVWVWVDKERWMHTTEIERPS